MRLGAKVVRELYQYLDCAITTQTNFDSTAHSKIYIVSAVVGIDVTLGAEKASSFTVQT